MEKSDFDRLLERYLIGQVSEQEKIKLEAWLDVMKTEEISDLDLSEEDEDKLFEKISRSTESIEQIREFRPGREDKIPQSGWVLRIAAGLMIVSLLSYAGWYFTKGYADRYETVSGNGIEKIILNDGTLAWLRGKSKLVYYEKPGENIRYVEFEGEALFEVTKNATRPFVIACGDVQARVLGTSFSLKTSKESIELHVLTGKVNLSSPGDKKGIDIAPHEKVIYSGKGKVAILPIPAGDVAALIEKTEYNMQFNNTGMGKVLERIEKKFNARVTVENKKLTMCRITADFTDRSLENTMQMLSELLELQYRIEKKIEKSSVMISGKGCN